MRALGFEGSPSARVRILSTVRVKVGLPHSGQRPARIYRTRERQSARQPCPGRHTFMLSISRRCLGARLATEGLSTAALMLLYS
ncbi:hypothetical protein E2C01_019003 [Portunus trituberculatus]|uniref:Uncharacterized protein n=1 Tax=Portunus trituberculatus TaxID=210409 RepID=A0A5B7DWI9_PORTR|nr:hypothetical protein [Portunus trituberculatus]